jgi:hypothetical protein
MGSLWLVYRQPGNIDTDSTPRFAALRSGPLTVGVTLYWLEHPAYTKIRERLIRYLRSDKYRFRTLEPVMFLCGGANSAPRDTLRVYLNRHFPEISLFYAEQVWLRIVPTAGSNALEMEDYLGQLADVLVIIVESPGTFTELGAFSLSEPLRKKLLPILDNRHRSPSSLIETGPARWISQDSLFKPPIYVNHTRILECVGELEERLSRIPKPKTTRIEDLSQSPKHVVFFICDLVAVIGPATATMIEYYIREIVPALSSSQTHTLISLAASVDLIRQVDLHPNGTSGKFFYRTVDDALTRPFHHKRFLDLPSRRADHVEVLQSIPEANQALQQLRKFL